MTKRQQNPSPGAIGLGILAGAAVIGGGFLIYRYVSKEREESSGAPVPPRPIEEQPELGEAIDFGVLDEDCLDVRSVEPIAVETESGDHTVVIRGINFERIGVDDVAVVDAVTGEGDITFVRSLNVFDDTTIAFKIGTTSVAPGMYDIVVDPPPDSGCPQLVIEDGIEVVERGGLAGGTPDEEDPTAAGRALYAGRRRAIDEAIRVLLDDAAEQKGIDGGWQARRITALARAPMPGDVAGQPERGPDVWNQAEAWWVAVNAYDDVFPDAELRRFGQGENAIGAEWAANVNLEPPLPEAWALGMIMAKVMGMTGAESRAIGFTTPDWSLFA